MILAVLYIIATIVLLGWPASLWLFSRLRRIQLSAMREALTAASFALAMVLSVVTCLVAMRSGVRALERMNR